MILTEAAGIRVSSVREPFSSAAFRPVGDERSATFEIRAEAAFLPPRVRRCIVDLLHYSMTGDGLDEAIVRGVTRAAIDGYGAGGSARSGNVLFCASGSPPPNDNFEKNRIQRQI